MVPETAAVEVVVALGLDEDVTFYEIEQADGAAFAWKVALC